MNKELTFWLAHSYLYRCILLIIFDIAAITTIFPKAFRQHKQEIQLLGLGRPQPIVDAWGPAQ